MMVDGEEKNWKQLAAEWAFKQGVSTVLLLGFVGVLVWGGRYAVTTAIPEHLKTIQEGYDRNAAVLAESLAKSTAASAEAQSRSDKAHSEAINQIISASDRRNSEFIEFVRDVRREQADKK